MKPYYKLLKKKIVFSKGPVHLTDSLIRLRSGIVTSRQILEHPGAVVLLPRLEKDKYILIKQFRFAAGKWLWEWPAGGIEKGESLKASATRELMEEAGYRPRKLTKVTEFYPTPGISGEIMHLFLAERLVPESAPQDHDEDIRTQVFSLAKIGKMIQKGQIEDAKTIVGYFYLKELFGR